MCSYNSTLDSSAHALEKASETPRIAFAPKRDLFFVPSRLIKKLSRDLCSKSLPEIFFCISPLTDPTAFSTPRPPNRCLSLSRSSTTSWTPVLAPDGTENLPEAPLSNLQKTSTVGFPRESIISLAVTKFIFAIFIND